MQLKGDLKVMLNNVNTMFQATELQWDIENLNAIWSELVRAQERVWHSVSKIDSFVDNQ